MEAGKLKIRGQEVDLPAREEYEENDIELTDPEEIHVYELCRLKAISHRELLLANAQERRKHVPPELKQVRSGV